MDYLIDTKELDENVQEQIRKFRYESAGTDIKGWYKVQSAIIKANDLKIYHTDMDKLIMPNLFDCSEIEAMDFYYLRDPQQAQVNAVERNLAKSEKHTYSRGRVSRTKLKAIMQEILRIRLDNYLNKKTDMEKLKIMCIVGGSGVGKTLASLHLKYHKDANVICSFTTRPPRSTEVEGRDHHFIDIVPDRTELLAYTRYGTADYYATKLQVFGPCTVYVIDEKGLENLRKDHGDEYRIFTVFIKRKIALRRRSGVDDTRIRRDERRHLVESDYDYVVENNGKKKPFFEEIERIYEEIKNK